MFKPKPLLTIVAFIIAIPFGVAHAGAGSLGPNPTVAGGTYTSPGGMSAALVVRKIQGKTAVCGVWAKSKSQSVMTRGAEKKILRSGAVVLNGKTLLRNLSFLREVAPATSYANMEGHCRLTNQVWKQGNDKGTVQIVLPRQIVYRDLGDEMSGGIIIRFRPTGPSAHPDDPKPWD